MKKFIIIESLILFCLFVLLGCGQEKDSSLGLNLVPYKGPGELTTVGPIPALEKISFRVTAKLGLGQTLIVGNIEGTPVKGLILFSAFTPKVKVVSAKMRLFSVNSYVPENANTELIIRAHKVLTRWSEDDPALPENIQYDPNEISSSSVGSSSSDSLVMDLPNELVQSWIDSTGAQNYGILFESPSVNSFIKGFASRRSSPAPILELVYEKETGSTSTTEQIKASQTGYFMASSTSPSEQPGEANIVASGDIYRSFIFFALPDSISPDVVVNSAVFRQPIKKTLFTSKSKQMSLRIMPLKSVFQNQGVIDADSSKVGSITLSDTTLYIEIEIHSLIEEWIKNPNVNYGLILSAANETDDINKLFLGKPELKVIYSRSAFGVAKRKGERL